MRHYQVVVRYADVFLRGVQIAELRVLAEHRAYRFQHVFNAPVYLAAYEAGVLYFTALFCLCSFCEENAFIFEYFSAQRAKVGVEHKSQRQAVVLLEQAVEVRMAEP